MTGNKGIDVLFRAFAEVARKHPHTFLVLKGMEPLYKSKTFLLENMKVLSAEERERVEQRLIYFGNSFETKKMARLYQAADVYVAPYRAEGFNLPVLEAAASGIPVICTSGGATDDFVTEAFARKIDSKKHFGLREGQHLSRLEPDVDHLIALMSSAIEERSWREAAAKAGPLHAQANCTWDHVVDILLGKLFPAEGHR